MVELDQDTRVTLVTRNSKGEQIAGVVQLLLYAGVIWYVTHPDQAEKAKDRLWHWRNRVIHRLSVWQARVAIQSLPETPE